MEPLWFRLLIAVKAYLLMSPRCLSHAQTGMNQQFLFACRRALRPDSPVALLQVDDPISYAACGVILGGRIGYMLFYGFEQILDNPLNILRIREGGMSFHGGFIGALNRGVPLCR